MCANGRKREMEEDGGLVGKMRLGRLKIFVQTLVEMVIFGLLLRTDSENGVFEGLGCYGEGGYECNTLIGGDGRRRGDFVECFILITRSNNIVSIVERNI